MLGNLKTLVSYSLLGICLVSLGGGAILFLKRTYSTLIVMFFIEINQDLMWLEV